MDLQGGKIKRSFNVLLWPFENRRVKCINWRKDKLKFQYSKQRRVEQEMRDAYARCMVVPIGF